jgi:hypothetical protein
MSSHNLFELLWNSTQSLSKNEILAVIERDPEALQEQDDNLNLPIHIECKNQCRSAVLTKCVELYLGLSI